MPKITQPVKPGRPSTYAPDVAAAILERIANGESLAAVCRSEGMPRQSAVYEWLIRHPEFAEAYARAREDQADTLADEIIDIADTSAQGDEQRAKLRVDARKWIAAKLKPKKYGEKIQTEHSGGVKVLTVSGSEADL